MRSHNTSSESTRRFLPSFDRAEPAAVRETHSALVVLWGDRAYKTKKAVDLGFLDFSSTASRRDACQRELLLNQRFAPDVYLGVADVVSPFGAAIDSMLVMRRMPDERRLADLVRNGAHLQDDIRSIARLIAAFHASAPTSPAIDRAGSHVALEHRWRSNLESLRALQPARLGGAEVDAFEQEAMSYIAGRHGLLGARIRQGRIRDGHGDLLADDIFLLPDGPRVLDCLDFDERLRWMDVLDDVACLVMDLERLGVPQLAQRFALDYAEFSGTPQPASLLHHYVAYRALMRAKVAALKEAQAADGQDRTTLAADVRRLADITQRHLSLGTVRLVLVGGPPASGKSALSGALADTLGAMVVSSDRTRKELLGHDPTVPSPAPWRHGLYTAEATRRTYARMGSLARSALRMGESVVVEATFSTTAQRAELRRIARDTHAALSELICAAPPDVRRRRLGDRALHPARYSDAGLGVGSRLAEEYEPWPEASPVDTSGSVTEACADGMSVLGVRDQRATVSSGT